MEKHKDVTATKLDTLYREAEACDQSLFAEMRTNLLLVAGDHYTAKGSRFYNRIRSEKSLTESQKLRLTKNHTKTIRDIYIGNILAQSPNVTILPNNKSELKDQKSAQLNLSVWKYISKKSQMRKKLRRWAGDFFDMGECICKVYWDIEAGEKMGFAPLVDVDGEHSIDPATGQLLWEPRMSGGFVYERVLSVNALRDPEVEETENLPFWIIRKMLPKEKIEQFVDPRTGKKFDFDTIKENEKTFMVFDLLTNQYKAEEQLAMVREHYYRPCKQYPKGYFYICLSGLILAEGELPYGVWPIAIAGCDEISTSPRHRSPIKQIRPYQVEINRVASQIATTQITMGDDKLVMWNGSSIAPSGEQPGIRAINAVGGSGTPTVIPGSTGDKLIPYMEGQIAELYRKMNATESSGMDKDGKLDPFALLYSSIKDREKFSPYGEAFEEFLIDICTITLKLAKKYLPDDAVIPMIDAKEAVNIPEFKNTDPLDHQIQAESISTTADTMLGKQLMITNALQYVGGKLERDDIAKLMQASPFLEAEELFSELRLEQEIATNDLLALERGQIPELHTYIKPTYFINKATHRMSQSDFTTLNPQIQGNFKQYITQYEEMETQNLLAAQRLKSGFIPIDGYKVKCDFYHTNKEGKTKRLTLPYSSISWLVNQLQSQGTPVEMIDQMPGGVAQDISKMMPQQGQQGPQQGPAMGQNGPMPPQQQMLPNIGQ